jgi:hypothetical protein
MHKDTHCQSVRDERLVALAWLYIDSGGSVMKTTSVVVSMLSSTSRTVDHTLMRLLSSDDADYLYGI